MVISWTESRRAVPRWQQIPKCFVLTKLVQSNQGGPDTMINIPQSCAGVGEKPTGQGRRTGVRKVKRVNNRPISPSDSTLMQSHLRHKHRRLLLISAVAFCCLSRLISIFFFFFPAAQTVGHFHTHTFLYIQLWQVHNRREWAGARKAGGSWPWRRSPSAHTELFYVMI